MPDSTQFPSTFLSKFKTTSSDPSKKGDIEQPLGKILHNYEIDLRASYHFAKDVGNRLWRWNPSTGVYEPDAEEFIAAWLKYMMERDNHNHRFSTECYNNLTIRIRHSCARLWERPPVGLIAVNNGILEIKPADKKGDPPIHILHKHCPHKWLSPIKLNCDYDPAAVCDEWDKRLVPLLPPEEPDLLYKILAWLIGPEGNTQQAVVFVGEVGGEGKSTIASAIKAVLGSICYTITSIPLLETNRFETSSLYGKLAAFDDDMQTVSNKTGAIFKQCVAQSEIRAEHKMKAAFFFTPFCKFIMCSNRLPTSDEGGNAWARRWITIKFDGAPKAADGKPAERLLPSKLSALLHHPTQLAGALNKALVHYTEVQENGLNLSEAFVEASRSLMVDNDSLNMWIKDSICADFSTNEQTGTYYFLHSDEIYSRYKEEFVKANRAVGLTEQSFSRLITQIFPKHKPVQEGGGQRKYYRRHLRWKTRP